MARIFDRETLLDLTVNVIPLGIILFFAVGFLIFNPWASLDQFGQLVAMGLLVVPFVALALLTYVSGKAIAGDEKRAEMYFQGQATMDDARTRAEAEAHGDEAPEGDLADGEPSTVEDGETAEESAASGSETGSR
ncbi:DUF6684 family protein [Halorarum halobium]|uniref:DUF6684 family protein n=1 Tax=Halorarum halobium TaxID=3075121 RepID=UPI0028B05EE6|nr:DUF6684 family protein [Halobaculum sp. XH14]